MVVSSTTFKEKAVASRMNAADLKFLTGRNGGLQVSYDGFIYTFDRQLKKGGTCYWQCRDRRNYNPPCTARLFTTGREEGSRVIRVKEHTSHGRSLDIVNQAHILSDLKNTNSSESPSNIVRNLLETLPQAVRSNLPNENCLKQRIRRDRKKNSGSSSAAELFIPQEFTKDAQGLKFLQHDTTTSEGGRVLIFATDFLLDFINDPEVTIGYLDGDLESPSPQFSQVWIIRASLKGLTYPVVYALLENKTEESYTCVLEFLRVKCPCFQPSIFIMNFEAGEFNAIKNIFSHSHIQGCHQHFTQQIRNKINLIFPDVQDDPVLSVLIACFYSLPFIPCQHVDTAFQELKTVLFLIYPESERILNFIQYFQKIWIDSHHVTAPEVWNVYKSALEGTPRTNNRSDEGTNVAVGASNIYALISVLRKENSLNEGRVSHYLEAPEEVPEEKPSMAWIEQEGKILSLIQSFDPNISKIPLLRQLGCDYI